MFLTRATRGLGAWSRVVWHLFVAFIIRHEHGFRAWHGRSYHQDVVYLITYYDVRHCVEHTALCDSRAQSLNVLFMIRVYIKCCSFGTLSHTDSCLFLLYDVCVLWLSRLPLISHHMINFRCVLREITEDCTVY